jgi:hypothetical protein
MKFRSRRLLTRRSAGPVCRVLRVARVSSSPRRDDRIERFVHEETCLVAAPVPKVASQTFKYMFRRLSGSGTSLETALRPDEIREIYPRHFIFSFVRNPWARIYSCWKDKIEDAITLGKVSIISRFPDLYPFMPFEEFVEWLETDAGGDACADRHWLSQTAHLTASNGETYCDFIGSIESLERDLSEIERRTDLRLGIPCALNVQTRVEGYSTIYTPRARKIVGRRYAEDIETFRYRFT